MSRFVSTLIVVNRMVIALVLAAVFALVFANVIGRYVFSHSFAFAEEAARHLMIFGAFAGAGLALREGRLVALDLLPDLLPPPASRLVRWLEVLVMLLFMGAMAWLGAKFVAFGWPKETMSTHMSRGIPYMAVPIGCALFVLHLVIFAPRYVAKEFDIEAGEDGDRDHLPNAGGGSGL